MKTNFKNSLKKLFIFAIACTMLSLYSCKSKDTVEPSIADQVTGSYTVTSIAQGGTVITLPVNGISGEYSVKKISDTKVAVSYVLKSAGNPNDTGQQDALLQKASDGSIEFYTDGKVGTYNNRTITFEFDDENGRIQIVANKK